MRQFEWRIILAFLGSVFFFGALSYAQTGPFISRAGNSGTVTGVSGTAPIVSTGGAAPVLSVNAASASSSGVLTLVGGNLAVDAGVVNVSTEFGFNSSAASGSNGFAVTTNGARFDFGAGANDYCSSNGTVVNFASPLTCNGAVSFDGGIYANGNVFFDAGTTMLNGNLVVDGGTVLYGTVSIDGGVNITGATSIAGVLGVVATQSTFNGGTGGSYILNLSNTLNTTVGDVFQVNTSSSTNPTGAGGMITGVTGGVGISFAVSAAGVVTLTGSGERLIIDRAAGLELDGPGYAAIGSGSGGSVITSSAKNFEVYSGANLTIQTNPATSITFLDGILNTYLNGTLPSGTGVTVNKGSAVTASVHKVTVAFTAPATGAGLTFDQTIWTIPAQTKVVRVIADVTVAFTGGAISAGTISVGKTVGGTEYLLAASDFTTGTFGDAMAEEGAALSGGLEDFPAWGSTTAISARFTSVGANTSAYTAGSVTFYIESVRYP